ncbi:MAG: hypothetical protein NTY99_00270 [DPANN group archaeon]|nr:hypothetical protein [DPANN group archaeon]
MKQIPLKLKKLPSVLTLNKFDKNGLAGEWRPSNLDDKGMYVVHLPNGRKVESIEYDAYVPAYVASELGFNFPGQYFLNEFFYPKLADQGILPLCPFAACGEYLDQKVFDENLSVKKNKELWNKFNDGIIPKVNYNTLIPRSKMLIAILDGSHALDDGVSAEIAHYATKFPDRPVIGIRSDFRLAENPAGNINSAVKYFLTHFFVGPNAYTDALESMKNIAYNIKEGFVPKGLNTCRLE